MIRAILIDDEESALNVLTNNLMQECPEVTIMASCQSAKEGMKAINKHNPDVVFLDISMPHMDGFEMLECMGNIDFNVVFVTAHNEHAVRAFRMSAVDYLLKPIDKTHLKEAVRKVLEKKENILPQEQLNILINNIKKPTDPFRKIGIYANKGVVFVHVNDIVYCESDGNYTWVNLSNGKKLFASEPLKTLSEEKLNSFPFCRIHNQHLININHAKEYVKGDGGYVVMDNGKSLSVSRAKKEGLLEMIGG